MTAIPTTERAGTSVPALPRLAAGVLVIAGLVVVALVLVAGRYGFLGDEFYFVVTGRHLQLAAPDNPMLVPYLAAGWYAFVGGHLWAFRILPALAAGRLRGARRPDGPGVRSASARIRWRPRWPSR